MHSKKNRKLKRKINLRILLTVIALALIIGIIVRPDRKPATLLGSSRSNSRVDINTDSQPSFNKSQYSVNDPTSIWAVVNKGRILSSNYAPSDLVVPSVPLRLSNGSPEMHVRQVASTAMQQMFSAANTEGIHLMLSSGYRSYAEQIGLYNGYVRIQGQASADSSSARPGHSEHQTGLAADLEPASRKCEVEECFTDTPEGQWLEVNCYKYGFIIRYTKNQQNLTGYEYEPWHIRYVGTDLAAQIHQNGQTLEQFFNLPAYTDYPAISYQLTIGR